MVEDQAEQANEEDTDEEEVEWMPDVRTQNARDKEKNFRQLNAGGKN